jgi:hypothetical protein
MSHMGVMTRAALDVTRDFFAAVKTHLDCPHCDLLVTSDQETLWSHHASGWFIHIRGQGVTRGSGLSWITIREERIQIFHNPGLHPEVVGNEPHHAPQGVQASAPMFDSNGQPLAVIHLLRSATQPFTAEELAWLEARCAELSPELEQALRTDAELERLVMQQSSPGLRTRMQHALDFAKYLGESPVYARAVAMGAMLLSNEICLEALQNTPMPLETREVLEYRHARFDGTGDPAAQGPRIPMSARIALVSVGFEQHLETGSDASYALALLRREAGWRLDPLLVKALEQHVFAQSEIGSKKLEPLDSSLAI